jgi:uncharacterized protein (DUF2461 family)
MFDGFSQKTVSILLSIRFNNNREYFNTIKQEYIENVKKPLELLYHYLRDAFMALYPVYALIKDALQKK